jgi:PKD repeat protein
MERNLPNQIGMRMYLGKAKITRMLSARRIVMLMSFFCLCAISGFAQVGTWTALPLAPHDNNGQMVLLTDGRIMCHTTSGGSQGDGTIWDILTPDTLGSYVHGTWSSTAGMTQERFSFPTEVLQSGKVYAAGGEYGTDGTQAGYHAETYDPVANTWTEVTGTATAKVISDGNCKLLDNGKVLQAEVDVSFPVHTMIYTPGTNAMTTGPSTLHGQNESMWLKLPDNSVLFVDEGATTSERYIPATNTWIADGTVPVSLYDPYGEECGPAWMLPDGRAFFIGGTNTATFYSPSGTTAPGTWHKAPAPPNGYSMPDAPGAMMVNGKILFACSLAPTQANEFSNPTYFYEFNYLDSAYTAVAAPNASVANSAISQQYTMINLPNGQVMLSVDQSNTANQYYVYNPTGTPLAAGKPTISSVTRLNCTNYMVTGHKFNGISEGSAFGDENENDTNYPLFRFKKGNRVYYAKSYNWNSTGVQRGVLNDTAYFTLPATMGNGSYYMYAVANGIASDSIVFNDSVPTLSSPLTNSVCSGAAFTYIPTSTTPGATFTWTRPAVTGISNAAITTAQTINPNETLVNTTAAPVVVTYAYTVTGYGCGNAVNVSVTVNPKPAASFTASLLSSCVLPDSVTFTNTTVAGSTYIWTFGDGTTGTATNPEHPYTAGGTYTVKLVANSACGTDSITKTNYITNTAPSAPAAASVSHCGSSSFSLSASTTNHVAWYDTTGAFKSSANPYVTPVLTQTTTYYVQDSVINPIDSFGPATYTTLGAGAIFTNTNAHYETFDAYTNFTLVSVVVDASTAGARTIQLLNSAGTVLATATPTIPVGVSTVALNFNVPIGTGYELSCGGTVNLYRNSAVTTYPFTLAGVGSITGSDAGSGYYYYFYNWKVQIPACVSARTAVVASIYPTVAGAAHVKQVACNGGATGADTAIVTGGTQTFTYLWSNTQTTNIISGLTAGTYTVTITDAHSCSATATSIITQPTALAVTSAITNPSCTTTGKVALTVSGGTSAYTYLWNTIPVQTTATATNLIGGTYTVTVTDAHGCTFSNSYTVAPFTSNFTLSTSTVNASCGLSNGSATVTVVTGPGGYTYLWSAGGNTTAATDGSLGSGSYTVTVSGTGGCTATATASVSSAGGPVVSSTTVASTCAGNNGSAHARVTSGTGPFTYTWSNAMTDSVITGLASGTYTVTVKDAGGCQSISSVTVAASTGLSLTPAATATSCGLTNGAASITEANPLNPFYHWSNSATTSSISNVASGNYTVTVTDNGCSATASVSVTASTSVTLTPASTATTCNNSNGSASITVTNPVSPVYHWSNSATTSSITNVASGTYTVTVTNNGCSATSSISVAASTGVSLTPASTATTCNNSNGAASITVANPLSPTYHWSNNATTSSISNVVSGTYTVTVNNSGCSATASISVAASAGVSMTPASTATTCGNTNGSASITVANPVSPTYHWSNSSTTASISNVASGTYTVTVNNNGCSATSSISVGASTAVAITTSSVPTACGNNTSGSATVSVANPVNPVYHWSNAGTTATISNVASATYTVTVTDNGCSATASVSVGASTGVSLSGSSVATTCGGTNGSATVTVGNPVNPVYHWSNNSTTATISNVAAGSYTVTVTDNGCSATASVSVTTGTSGLTVTPSITAAACFGGANGGASVTVSGGTPGYTYSWSQGLSTTNTISNVSAGAYIVTVSDAGGCSHTLTVTVGQPTEVTSSATSTTVNCFGGANGTATVSAGGGTPGYTYVWGNSQSSTTISSLSAGTYNVTVYDNNHCSSTASVNVVQPNVLSVTITHVNPSQGQTTGSATISSITGGTPAYSETWSNSQTGDSATNLTPGTYTVTVTDANGCSQTDTVVISRPNGIATITDGIEFNIYPNPAKTTVTVSLQNTLDNATITLHDILGQTLDSQTMKGSQATFELGSYASGVYFIEVTQNGKKAVKKLTINK